MLGDFRIVRLLGRGGMGVVYEAEQISLQRRVAIKTLPFAGVLNQRQLARFKNEALAAAALQHPNIVPVYAIGVDRGVHFYAMQYISGRNLAELIHDLRVQEGLDSPDNSAATAASQQRPGSKEDCCFPLDQRPGCAGKLSDFASTLDTFHGSPTRCSRKDLAAYFREVARIGMEVAEALAHAHAEGVIHRDIKPSNLMLDDDGKIWITDFGLAQTRADHGLTVTGDLVGTPRYMSPEQGLGKGAPFDHRTDIYSLAATLYELLALQPVFSGVGKAAILQQATSEYPRSLTRIQPRVPRELETIVLKSLSKEPADRYDTAQSLADDLRRFLAGQPIKAQRQSATTRCMRWAVHHPERAGFGAFAIVVLLLATVVFAWSRSRLTAAAREHRLQQQAIESEKAAAQIQSFFAKLGRVKGRNLRRQPGWRAENLEEIRQAASIAPDETSRRELRGELAATLAGHDLGRIDTLLDDFESYGLLWSPDENTLAVGQNSDQNGQVTIQLFSGSTPVRKRTLTFRTSREEVPGVRRPEGVRSLLFSPDSRKLFVGTRHGKILIFDVASGALERAWQAHDDYIHDLLLIDDGVLASSSKDRSVRFWRLSDQQCVRVENTAGEAADLCRVGDTLFVDSHDVETLALTGALGNDSTQTRSVWDLDANRLVAGPDGLGLIAARAEDIAILHGNRRVAIRKFVDPRRQRLHTTALEDAELSRDGRWFLTAFDKTIRLWDFLAGRPLVSASFGGQTRVEGAFAPLTSRLAITGDYRVHLYQIEEDPAFGAVLAHSLPIEAIDLTPDGSTLAAAIVGDGVTDNATTVCLYDTAGKGTETIRVDGFQVSAISLAPSGRGVFLTSNASRVQLIDRQEVSQRPRRTFKAPANPQSAPDGKLFWFSADAPKGHLPGARKEPSRLVAVDAVSNRTQFSWVNLESERDLRSSAIKGIAVGSRRVVIASDDHTLRWFDPGHQEPQAVIRLARVTPECIALSGDENVAVIGTRGGQLIVVNLDSERAEDPVQVQAEPVTFLGLAKNGLVVSGGQDSAIQFWQLAGEHLRPLFRLDGWTNPVKSLSLSEDGRILAVLLEGEGGVRLVRMDLLRKRLGQFGLDWTN
jgi:serine/threonine protein kinase/WD40 repeat protein